MLQRLVAGVVGISMLGQVALVPRRADAGVISALAAPTFWAIALAWGGGSLAVVSVHHLIALRDAGKGERLWRVLGALVTGIGAVVLLDAESESKGFRVGELSGLQARAAGLTQSEWLAYNGERLEIGALAEQAMAEAERTVGTEDMVRFVEQVRANWERDSELLLSPDARAAASKIARSAVQLP